GLTAITNVALAADQSHVTDLGAFDITTNDISLTVEGSIDANMVTVEGTGATTFFDNALTGVSVDLTEVTNLLTNISGDMITTSYFDAAIGTPVGANVLSDIASVKSDTTTISANVNQVKAIANAT